MRYAVYAAIAGVLFPGGCGATAAKPAETASAAAPTSAPPKYSPPDEVRAQWKRDMEAACAGDDATLQRASFDVTGDGQAEQICWRVVKGEPNGEYLDLIVRHVAGAKTQSAYILLPISGGVQAGVCHEDHYTVTQEKWTKDARADMGIPDDWPTLGLTVGGGDCDPLYLFWPNDADQLPDDKVRFYFARL